MLVEISIAGEPYWGKVSRFAWIRTYLSIKRYPNLSDYWVYLPIKHLKGMGNCHKYEDGKVLYVRPKDFRCILKLY